VGTTEHQLHDPFAELPAGLEEEFDRHDEQKRQPGYRQAILRSKRLQPEFWGIRRGTIARSAPPTMRQPERRSSRQATRRAGTRRRASSTTRDDGSGEPGDDPPPPAQPQRRGDEQDRGNFTSRPRRTGGRLIHVAELMFGARRIGGAR
jgi:hypothetical protein